MTDAEQWPTQQLTESEHVEAALLIDRLPSRIEAAARQQGLAGLIEIVLDLGRVPTARYHQGSEVTLSDDEVTQQEIDQTVAQLS